MDINITLSSLNRRIVISDVFVLALVYFIPAIAHLVPFSLYLFDPMRILLFTGYLLSRNHKNAVILALTIPLFSVFISGHPLFFKAALISVELLVNIWFFIFLLEKVRWATPVVLFLSILASKVVYYILKYVLISFSIIDGKLVSTNLMVQFIVVMIITIIFSFFFKKQADTIQN